MVTVCFRRHAYPDGNDAGFRLDQLLRPAALATATTGCAMISEERSRDGGNAAQTEDTLRRRMAQSGIASVIGA